jgi:hypothetical protein
VVPARSGGPRPHGAGAAFGPELLGEHRLRCLRTARASADLLRRLPLPEAVVVADAVQHARLVEAAELEVELAAQARLRGIRRRGGPWSCRTVVRSPLRRPASLAFLLADLAPVPQYEVRVQGRFVARVDLAFPAAKVAVEYDGQAVHERQDAFTRDRQRQNELVRAGWDGAALHERGTSAGAPLRPSPRCVLSWPPPAPPEARRSWAFARR